MPHKTEAHGAAEHDAEVLVNAELVRADPKRFKAATTHLEKMAKATKKATKK